MNYVVSVWRGFLFLWVLGMGYVILLWHSLSLPYNYFTLIVNFRAKGNNKGKQPPLKKRASGVNFASQHTVKKRQDSSDVKQAEKPNRKQKKTPAQVAKDRARRKAYWKNIKVARKLRPENFAAHKAQLLETRTVASPQIVLVSQSENSGCFDITSSVSESNRHLTIEGESVNTAQDHSELNRLSAEVAGTAFQYFGGRF